MFRSLGLIAIAVLSGALSFALSASDAFANHVRCGEVLTRDTTLDSDLIDCTGHGLVIGADGITVDLNRHVVDGDGSGLEHHGIDNGNGAGDVRVVGPGVVQEFGNGIFLANASDNLVRGVQVSRNRESGIRLEGDTATQNLIVDNLAFENNDGVAITDEYAQNVDAGRNTVRNNVAFANFHGILLGGYGDGNRIAHNSLEDNAVGIELSDSFGASLIEQNRLSRNGSGISLFESQNSHVRQNRVSHSGNGPLISSGDGIFVDDRNNMIEKNFTSFNARDGINVGPATTLRGNVATRNGRLGIEASVGIVDAGGNRAFGNGDPLQCLNVMCK
jgi:parallel beta-helix repeat protein